MLRASGIGILVRIIYLFIPRAGGSGAKGSGGEGRAGSPPFSLGRFNLSLKMDILLGEGMPH